MLKILLAAAPYLLKGPSKTSKKQIARSLMALVLFGLSGLAFAAAAFIYLTSLYGAVIGFMSVSGLFLITGLGLSYKAKRPKRVRGETPPEVSTTDPIAALVPDALLDDPAVKKLMDQVSANPVAASLAAATIGMLITRKIMKD